MLLLVKSLKSNKHYLSLFASISYLLFSSPAFAACPTDDAVATRALGYINNQPLEAYPEDMSLEDAYCAQAKYVARIKASYGNVIGYKVGFTGQALQKRFNIPKPATGILLAEMMVPDGSTIAKDFGFRTLIEPDMIVTVKDDGIMQATNEMEVTAHLDEVRAFIELPAIQLNTETQLTGATLVAFNIAARAGVYGEGRKVEATPEFVQALADMETVFTDETGTVIQSEPGSNLLGHPLKVVLWLIEEMKARGESLKAGQIISLGAFGQLFPIKENGKTYTLTYQGLPGGPVSTSIHIK